MSLFPDATPALPPEWIHAHCDGGSRGNPGPAGFGAVITDARGGKLAELSEFLGTRTNNFAEYSGLLAVLSWTLQHGYTQLKVVSDSELMVKQIQGRYKVNSPDLKPLWQEARHRIEKLARFEISHALRHKNKEADALANQAMDRGTGKGAAGRPLGVQAAGPKTDIPVESLPLRARPTPSQPLQVRTARPAASDEPAMLRGFVKDGKVHLLGAATLPDGIFVKIVRE